MENSIAYQIGAVLGAILVVGTVVGIFVFFVIALIRAIKTGRKGWIIAASIFGLPVAAFVILLLIGIAVGIMRGGGSPLSFSSPKMETAADLLTGSMTPVTGTIIPYKISYPWINSWKQADVSNGAFDQLYSYHDAYIGVVAEGIGVGTPQRICELSQKNLAAKASQYTVTTPKSIEIDSHPWMTYDATATVSGVDLKYRFYVYSNSEFTFQVISWTGPGVFNSITPVFDRIAESFKMPK